MTTLNWDLGRSQVQIDEVVCDVRFLDFLFNPLHAKFEVLSYCDVVDRDHGLIG